eukprot:scaffold149522_cov125-Cyclotella_meneghiniana.AAC.2
MMASKGENTLHTGTAAADPQDQDQSFNGSSRKVAKTRQTDHTYHDWARHPINGQPHGRGKLLLH